MNIEEGQGKLIAKACMYGAGRNLLRKAPELEENDAFRKILNRVTQELEQAAIDYFNLINSIE